VIDTDSSAKLEFSTDTLTFDTVFTTLGSTTLYFKVYNPNRHTVKTDVWLAGGDASNFRLNIDGITGNRYAGLEVYGKDSTYVFVEVTVDPNGLNTPLVIYDSVLFMTNGNRQKVVLEAWGQDAHFFRDSLITTTTWFNDRPYVILNTAVVDSGHTLTISPGTQIFMGGNGRLIVYGTGKIIINGTKEDTVVFDGVRLEHFYDNLPGQWSGIFILRGSTGNSINYAVIKNSDFGINLGSVPVVIDDCNDIAENFSFANAPEVTITNTIIKNSFRNGLSGLLSKINAENCLLFNSGDYLASFAFGGIYNLNHCTLANFGSVTVNHQKPTLFFSNLLVCDNTPFIGELLLTVENTIVYGSLDEELEFEAQDTTLFYALFDHCLLKTNIAPDTVQFDSVIKNEDPQFTDRQKDDYTIKETSPCRDAGKPTSVTTDLKGNQRMLPYDIGAYEYQ